MKKILLLGGSRYILPVIEKIHEMGHYAITCDYLPNNIAHKYSDEYHNVSIIDKDAVLELAQKIGVDGIMSFACDPGVETMAYVCEKLGLPCVGSYQSVLTLQDKVLFRKFLSDNNFNVPYAQGFDSIEEFLNNSNHFKFPVIVKPADSAGSKGVSRLDGIDNAKQIIERAVKYSKTKRFIVEEFIEKLGDSSDCDCFSVNGDMVFVSFSNQKFDDEAANPYTPAGFTWPPEMGRDNQNILVDELNRLCKLLNLKSSLYNVETRVGIDGKPYIMEVSPRGGGNRLSEMMKYVSGVDLIKEAILAAIGEKNNIDKMPEYNDYWYEHILHSQKDGIFDSLYIDDTIKKYVVEEDIWVKKGDEVKSFTGANETIGTIVFRFESYLQQFDTLNNIKNVVKINVKDI